MPGILPMKVIKVGNNTQSRIAQACDRCRSKKIRCDGVRPCCTQCANVGFECKTSDKLSRRAFPRGYTESLEERVRALESEVRDLKNLLDEKDEKIDVLSRIHSFTSPSQQKTTPSVTSPVQPAKSSAPAPAEGAVHVPEPVPVNGADEVESSGVSSTRGFAGMFPFYLNQIVLNSTERLWEQTLTDHLRCIYHQACRPRPVGTRDQHKIFNCIASAYLTDTFRPRTENSSSACIRSAH